MKPRLCILAASAALKFHGLPRVRIGDVGRVLVDDVHPVEEDDAAVRRRRGRDRPATLRKLGTPDVDFCEAGAPELNWYCTPLPLSASMCGDNALRFGWLTTCWGSVVAVVVVVGAPGVVGAGAVVVVVAGAVVVVVVARVEEVPAAAAAAAAAGTIRVQRAAATAMATFPQRRARACPRGLPHHVPDPHRHSTPLPSAIAPRRAGCSLYPRSGAPASASSGAHVRSSLDQHPLPLVPDEEVGRGEQIGLHLALVLEKFVRPQHLQRRLHPVDAVLRTDVVECAPQHVMQDFAVGRRYLQ